MIDWKAVMHKEREIWHERFYPSLIAAVGVLFITLVLQRSGFDIVLLTSIASSIVILTNKYKHRLTVLGTAVYSYIAAAMVGFLFLLIERNFFVSLVSISFFTIIAITLIIYLFDIFHPPAVGIALGIVLFDGPMATLFFILGMTFLVFFLVKVVMYLFYHHMTFREFHHEFMTWEKKLFH